MMKALSILFAQITVVLNSFSSVSGQFTNMWTWRFNDPVISNQKFSEMAIHNDTIIIGGLYDWDGITMYPMILKIDKLGKMIWYKVFMDSPSFYTGGDIAIDANGNIYTTQDTYYNINSVCKTLKINPWGDTIWTRIYSQSMGISPNDIEIDDQSNVYVTGSGFTLRYNQDGNLIWSSNFGGIKISIDENNSIYISNSDIICKIDENGNTLWTYDLPGKNSDSNHELKFDNEYNLIASTSQNINNQYWLDYLVKLNPEGDTLWVRNFNYSGYEYNRVSLKHFILDNSNNIIATGFHNPLYQPLDLILIKFDPDGNKIWEKTYPAANPLTGEYAHAIACDQAGNSILFGEISGGEYFANLLLVYDPDGNILYDTTYTDENIRYWASRIITTDYNDVFIAGIILSESGQTSPDIWVSRYMGTDTTFNCRIHKKDISCYGMDDGAAAAITYFGTPPYSYQWDDPGNSTDSVISGLTAGRIYHVTVTDADTNTCTDSTVLSEPAPLIITIQDTVSISFYGMPDGKAEFAASGGTKPYTYRWNHDASNTEPYSDSLYGNTWYLITVTDKNGCTATDSIRLAESNKLLVTIEIKQTSCFGDSNGILLALTHNGIPPYIYLWNNNPDLNDSILTGIAPGILSEVTITDAFQNTGYASEIFTGSDPIIPVIKYSEPISCNGFSDGLIWLDATGGNPPYQFIWPDLDNEVSSIVAGLEANHYYIFKVKDANNCSVTDSILLGVITMNSNPEVSGPTEVLQLHEYTYAATGNINSLFLWTVTNGNIVERTYSDEAQVIWNEAGEGTLSVQEITEWGCFGESDMLSVNITVGLNPLEKELIKIYPIPCDEILTIEIPENNFNKCLITIYNLSGRKVKSLIMNTIILGVNTNDLTEGLYFIEISGQQVYRRKFVISR